MGVRLPSPDDEFCEEDRADSRLIWGIRNRDSNQIAAAIMAGAPFGHTAREMLAAHFDEGMETLWTLTFRKRNGGRGVPARSRFAHHDFKTSIAMREVEEAVSKGIKLESAIAAACKKLGIGRAKAFELLAERRKHSEREAEESI